MQVLTSLYKIILTMLAIFLFLRSNSYANPLASNDQYLGTKNNDSFAFENIQSPKKIFNEMRNLHNNDTKNFSPKIVQSFLNKKKPIISKVAVLKNDIQQIRNNAKSEKANLNTEYKTPYNVDSRSLKIAKEVNDIDKSKIHADHDLISNMIVSKTIYIDEHIDKQFDPKKNIKDKNNHINLNKFYEPKVTDVTLNHQNTPISSFGGFPETQKGHTNNIQNFYRTNTIIEAGFGYPDSMIQKSKLDINLNSQAVSNSTKNRNKRQIKIKELNLDQFYFKNMLVPDLESNQLYNIYTHNPGFISHNTNLVHYFNDFMTMESNIIIKNEIISGKIKDQYIILERNMDFFYDGTNLLIINENGGFNILSSKNSLEINQFESEYKSFEQCKNKMLLIEVEHKTKCCIYAAELYRLRAKFPYLFLDSVINEALNRCFDPKYRGLAGYTNIKKLIIESHKRYKHESIIKNCKQRFPRWVCNEAYRN